MPHKPRPNGLHQRRYVKKDGELIHVRGKWRYFTSGEVVESPRHLSPSYIPWVQAQLRYEAHRRRSAKPRF